MNEEYDEDILIELESYLDTIKYETEEFKKIKNPSHIKIKEVRKFLNYVFNCLYRIRR